MKKSKKSKNTIKRTLELSTIFMCVSVRVGVCASVYVGYICVLLSVDV